MGTVKKIIRSKYKYSSKYIYTETPLSLMLGYTKLLIIIILNYYFTYYYV